VDINQAQLMLAGTMVTDDAWALRILGYESACAWWLFGASNSRPITCASSWTWRNDRPARVIAVVELLLAAALLIDRIVQWRK